MFGELENQMNAMTNKLFDAIPEDDEGAEDVSPGDSNNFNEDDGDNIPLTLAGSSSHNDGFSPIKLNDLISSNTNALVNNMNNNDIKNENNTNKLDGNLILNTLKQNSNSNLNSTSTSANNYINTLDRTGDSDIISASPSAMSQRFNEHYSESGNNDNINNEGRLVPQIQQIATSLINGNIDNTDNSQSARSNQSNRSNQNSLSNKNSSRSTKSTRSKISTTNSKQNSSASQSPRQLSSCSNGSNRAGALSTSLTKGQQKSSNNNSGASSRPPSSRSIKSNNSKLNLNEGSNGVNSSEQPSARSTKSSGRNKTNSAISSSRSNKDKDITQNPNNTDLSQIIQRPFSVLAGINEQAQPDEINYNNFQNKSNENKIDNQIQPDEMDNQTQPNEDDNQTQLDEIDNQTQPNEDDNRIQPDNITPKEDQQQLPPHLPPVNENEDIQNNETETNNNQEVENNNENNVNDQQNNQVGSSQNAIEEGLNVSDENPVVVPTISHFPKRTIYEEEELESKLREFIKTNGKSFSRIPSDMRNQLYQHILRRRVQSIENQDYDNGEKLMIAQENLRRLMNKDLIESEETNEDNLNASRLSDAKYELKSAIEKWDQNMKDLSYKLKLQEEKLISDQQEELQKLAEFWQDPSKFHEFNKASSQLLSMREIEKNMALNGDFQGAKIMKKRALALEKKETIEAQKRAQEAMEQSFSAKKAKHAMQLNAHRSLAHKLMTQEEVKREYELQPLRMAVKKYENYQKIKDDNKRETKPPAKRNPPVSKSMLVKKTKKDSILITDDRPPITTPRTMERLVNLRNLKRADQLALTKVETKTVLKKQIRDLNKIKVEKEPQSSRTKNNNF